MVEGPKTNTMEKENRKTGTLKTGERELGGRIIEEIECNNLKILSSLILTHT